MSEISDIEFDALMKELEVLENEFPEFDDPNSPTQRVGSDSTAEFTQEAHRYPMLSLSNTYSEEELREFDQRIQRAINEPIEYVCELKFDGASISLSYTNGILKRALTRGDGNVGDNVTANVKTIKSVPLVLQGSGYPEDFEIRGEIFIGKEGFRRMNELREEAGEALLVNPRNAASGTLKSQNSSVVGKRPLECYLYYITGENLPAATHSANLELAKTWGFRVSSDMKIAQNIEEVIAYINYWGENRQNLPFEIDGMVVKVNSLPQQARLGFTAKSPRWATSFKFKAERVASKLLSVDFQVGRTGSITPVANLSPIFLAGTTVKRASLHNADQIALFDLHLGDEVYIEKGGEIIPKLVGVNIEARAENAARLEFPTHCPECHTELVRNENEANHYCPNDLGCGPQITGRIEHFLSRKAMNINAASATALLLYEEGLVHNVADLYDLNFDQLTQLERFAEKSAINLIESIDASKSVPFHKVLYGLGIRYVGETVAKKLARSLPSIDEIMRADFETLTQIEEIGDKIAESIIRHFAIPANREIIERLKMAGLSLVADNSPKSQGSSLQGKKIVLSGTFVRSRDELKMLIEQYGGINQSSVSAKTDYFLMGENVGPSKLEKVRQFGVEVISEDALIQLIQA
jgi:DNA ligase (NAD+)